MLANQRSDPAPKTKLGQNGQWNRRIHRWFPRARNSVKPQKKLGTKRLGRRDEIQSNLSSTLEHFKGQDTPKKCKRKKNGWISRFDSELKKNKNHLRNEKKKLFQHDTFVHFFRSRPWRKVCIGDLKINAFKVLQVQYLMNVESARKVLQVQYLMNVESARKVLQVQYLLNVESAWKVHLSSILVECRIRLESTPSSILVECRIRLESTPSSILDECRIHLESTTSLRTSSEDCSITR